MAPFLQPARVLLPGATQTGVWNVSAPAEWSAS